MTQKAWLYQNCFNFQWGSERVLNSHRYRRDETDLNSLFPPCTSAETDTQTKQIKPWYYSMSLLTVSWFAQVSYKDRAEMIWEVTRCWCYIEWCKSSPHSQFQPPLFFFFFPQRQLHGMPHKSLFKKKDHILVFYLWYVLPHVFPTHSILASHRWGESKINIIKQGHQIFSVEVSEYFRMTRTV